jgi:hypothetical protein
MGQAEPPALHSSVSPAARRGLAYLGLAFGVPNGGLRTVGADGNRLLAAIPFDMQDSALAFADSFTHSRIHQKEEAIPLEDLAAITLRSIREDDLAGFMTLCHVRDAEGGRRVG